jgi:hypothetical protein
VVTVYNCGDDGDVPGGGKNPPGKTPTQLPGTGTGDAVMSLRFGGPTGAAESLGLLIAAGTVLALAQLVGRLSHRTRRYRVETPIAA